MPDYGSSGVGEANTASNVGTAGTGVFKQKTGVDLEFKKINAGSSKITITDDTGNSEVDVDVAEANLTLGNIGGTVGTTQIANDAVTYAKIQNVATDRLLGRDTASAGDTEEITVGGGIEFTGTGGIQTSAFTGDVTKSAGGTAQTIANDAVTYAKMQNVSATSRFLGRITAGAGDTEELTGTQATTLLDTFTSSLQGVVPASGGGTTNFLRADGTFAAPPGAGGGEANTASNVGAGGVGVFKQKTGVDLEFKNINSDSTITITDDTGNNEVDIKRAALTGDVTASAGSNSTTIANDAVSNAKLANMAGFTVKAKVDTGSGDPSDLSVAADRVVGRSGSGDIDDIQISTNHIASSITLTTPTLTTPTINGAKLAQAAKTANYTMTSTDYVVRCDASGGAFTITLPAAATAGAGTIYKIIRTDITSSSTLLTVDANASETIDGMLTWKLHQGEFLVVMSDGTNWVSISHPNPTVEGYYFLKDSTNNRRYVAGLHNGIIGPTTSTTSPAANNLWALPFVVSKVTKFDTITFHITTADAGDNANAGIYYDDGNCYPGALIFNTGSISTGSTGVKDTTITSSLQIFQPGLYWLAWETSATACQMRVLPNSTSLPIGFAHTSSDLLASPTTPGYGYEVADTYGATLPDPYPASATLLTTTPSASNPVPAIGLRAI